jgi:integrin-linked kinase
VIGACTEAPQLYVISQFMPFGSLFDVLHRQNSSSLVVDMSLALRFASDVARGMAFLHSLEKPDVRLFLNSKHVMIDEDMTARINMGDVKFTFQEKGKMFSPEWVAPEGNFFCICLILRVLIDRFFKHI